MVYFKTNFVREGNIWIIRKVRPVSIPVIVI